jgi:SAM-dependent methyltransferase
MSKPLDIARLYREKVNPFFSDTNARKYETLPLERNNLSWKWEGKDFPRVISILEFSEFVKMRSLKVEKLLSFASQDPEVEILNPKSISNYPYDENPTNYDLHTLNLPDKDFDFCLLNQTLEHLYNPIECLRNISPYLKTGGIIHVNAPANNIPHMVPYHYYTGFTLIGLVAALETAGYSVINCGQWGNLEYLTKMFSRMNWPDYRDLTTHRNEFNYPAIVWANAIKIL